jgi:hypothetical protein
MRNILFFFILVATVSCSIGYPTNGGGGFPQGQQVWQLPNQNHQHNYVNGRCYFRVQISSGGGLTRNGNTVTFHHGGTYCFADGITEEYWNHLQCGGTLEVQAYHH